jgi:hypothetical protein
MSALPLKADMLCVRINVRSAKSRRDLLQDLTAFSSSAAASTRHRELLVSASTVARQT